MYCRTRDTLDLRFRTTSFPGIPNYKNSKISKISIFIFLKIAKILKIKKKLFSSCKKFKNLWNRYTQSIYYYFYLLMSTFLYQQYLRCRTYLCDCFPVGQDRRKTGNESENKKSERNIWNESIQIIAKNICLKFLEGNKTEENR